MNLAPYLKYHEQKFSHYKNIALISAGFLLALALVFSGVIHTITDAFLAHGILAYIGAVLAGFLFSSTFTASIGGALLFSLGRHLHFIEIAALGALGSVICDLIILKFVRSAIADELEDFLTEYFRLDYFKRMIKTRYFKWTLPVLGAALIVSPLPDEIGVSLMGLTTMTQRKFIAVSYVLNFVGILLVMVVAYETAYLLDLRTN
jgi:hypothetical protein